MPSSILPDLATPNWMVVYTAAQIPEAAIVVGRLHSLGCPAQFLNKQTLIGLPGGSVKVIVPESHYNFAMATLYPDESIPLLGDGEEDDFDDDYEDEEFPEDL